jgi:hypothetical protein
MLFICIVICTGTGKKDSDRQKQQQIKKFQPREK